MKRSSKRKYAPKIIQHLIVSFSCLVISILLILITFEIWNNKVEINDFFSFINNNTTKTMLILIIANYGVFIYCAIMILLLQKKTQDGSIFVIFELVFSALIITAPFGLVFSILALKNNELVYE